MREDQYGSNADPSTHVSTLGKRRRSVESDRQSRSSTSTLDLPTKQPDDQRPAQDETLASLPPTSEAAQCRYSVYFTVRSDVLSLGQSVISVEPREDAVGGQTPRRPELSCTAGYEHDFAIPDVREEVDWYPCGCTRVHGQFDGVEFLVSDTYCDRSGTYTQSEPHLPVMGRRCVC